MESLIQEEVEAFNDNLKQQCGTAINIRNRFNISVINALWTLITGKRLPLNDPELLKLVAEMDRLVVQFSRRKVLNGFPWLRFVAPNLSGWTDWKASVDSLLTFLDT